MVLFKTTVLVVGELVPWFVNLAVDVCFWVGLLVATLKQFKELRGALEGLVGHDAAAAADTGHNSLRNHRLLRRFVIVYICPRFNHKITPTH